MTHTSIPQPVEHDDFSPLPALLPLVPDPRWPIPSKATCLAWWESYAMLDNIKAHSLQVARVATSITRLVIENTSNISTLHDPVKLIATVQAAALLHDLAKTYCIRHGGNHAQLGASWVVELTKNPAIGQGVLHHVFWPGPIDCIHFFIPLIIIYSDKRVRHDTIVPLDSRLEDLLKRYGSTDERRHLIRQSFEQVQKIEEQLEQQTGANLNAYHFDSRGLVE